MSPHRSTDTPTSSPLCLIFPSHTHTPLLPVKQRQTESEQQEVTHLHLVYTRLQTCEEGRVLTKCSQCSEVQQVRQISFSHEHNETNTLTTFSLSASVKQHLDKCSLCRVHLTAALNMIQSHTKDGGWVYIWCAADRAGNWTSFCVVVQHPGTKMCLQHQIFKTSWHEMLRQILGMIWITAHFRSGSCMSACVEKTLMHRCLEHLVWRK